MNSEPAPRVVGLRQLLDKYLPFVDVQEMMPMRTRTAGIKQAFDSNPRSWEQRPLTSDQVLFLAITAPGPVAF
jgi:hypothetical protein